MGGTTGGSGASVTLSDTGFTGGTGGPCVSLQGDGWACGPRGVDRCGHGRGEVQPPPDKTPPGAVLGGGACGCAGDAGVATWWVLCALAVLIRRTRWLALLASFAVLGHSSRAAAIDVENLDPDAGGTWLALREGDLGRPWDLRLGLAASVARNPAVLRIGRRETEWVGWLGTGTFAASLNLKRWAQLAVLAPYYPVVVEEDERIPAVRGDRSLRLTVPLSLADARTQLTWGIGLELATGKPKQLLGDGGTVWASGAMDHGLSDRVRVGGTLGVQLRQPVPIPGAVWGRMLTYGAATAWDAAPRVRLTAEAFGGLGLEGWYWGTLPLEVLGTARFATSDAVGVRLGAGSGIGRGLGNPQWRLVLAVDVAPPGTDRDHDRRPDVRDLCPSRPEDLDRFHDLEGCPDPDNDRDAILDPVDGCPDDAEVVNGWNDADGCPDDRAHIVVALAPDVDHADVDVGTETVAVVGGEEATVVVDPGEVLVEARADGFYPTTLRVRAPEGITRVPITLEPVPDSALVVRVADESGAPVVAAVSACDRLSNSEGGTLRILCRPGVVGIDIAGNGYDPVQTEAVVPETGEVIVDVVLHRPAVALVGQQLIVGDRIRFALDDDEVLGSEGALEALAAWLRAHPEVELLRIEGHADDTGSPGYNLDLSERRAASVVAALVARGIAAERLRPIGSGESRRAGDDVAERMVEFLVLVWDETRAAEAPTVLP